MALTTALRRRLKIALGNNKAGDAVADAIDSNGSGPAANVAAIGATTNLPTDTLANLAGVAETRLDGAEAKINAILTSLKNAGLMATS